MDLDTLKDGSVVSNLAISTIYRRSIAARDCLRTVIRLADESELSSVLRSIKSITSLRNSILNSMEKREEARENSTIGTVIQLGSLFFLSSPIGWATLIGGAYLSGSSEIKAKKEAERIEERIRKTSEIFDREEDRFENLQRALKSLDEAIVKLDEDFLKYFGQSLRNPNVRDFFLLNVCGAKHSPNFQSSLEFEDDLAFGSKRALFKDVDLERNRLELKKNKSVMSSMSLVVNLLRSESVAKGRMIALVTTAVKRLKSFELAAKCLTLYEEYKVNQKTMEELEDGIFHLKLKCDGMMNINSRLKEYDFQTERSVKALPDRNYFL